MSFDPRVSHLRRTWQPGEVQEVPVKSTCPRETQPTGASRLTLLALGETLHQDGQGGHSPYGEARPS